MGKKALHILALAAGTLLALLVIYRIFIGPVGVLAARLTGSPDAITSASVILDAPSGRFVVLLNEERHQKWDTADAWSQFFQGESLVIMDDVDCLVGEGDAVGIGMAESYRSRLPENQMKLRREDGLMMLSRAEAMGFDVIVLSEEFAQALSAQTLYGREGVRVIHVEGVSE